MSNFFCTKNGETFSSTFWVFFNKLDSFSGLKLEITREREREIERERKKKRVSKAKV